MSRTSSITSLKSASPESVRASTCRSLHKRSVAGFSLIEMMIAMVIGALVVAGLINLFIANRKAYQIQSGNNFLQENLRIASDRIGWSLRMADFWGGNNAADVQAGSAGTAISGKGTCNGSWATAINPALTDGGGVFGYVGSDSFPLGAACVGGNANYVKGSDALVLRYAEPTVLAPGPTPAVSSTIAKNAKEIFLLSTPGTSAQLFSGSTVPTNDTDTVRSYAYPYQVDMYYLRPCSVIGSGSTCSAKDDGGMPLPTLIRMHLQSDGSFVSEAVVDGIEQLKFEYGVASDMTNVVPTYMRADAMSSSQWANVVSVRVSLVAVSPVRDFVMPHTGTYTLGILDGACKYVISSGKTDVSTCKNFTPYGDKPWQFTRVRQQFVVQLRNRTRG
ncbi:MAG: PilW family protein [Rhodanobacter sp.]